MTTATVKEIQTQLKKWQPYIGKKAMIYSTSNYDKAMFELQMNPLENVELYHGNLEFKFTEGDKRQYGSLGCIYTRTREKVCFTLEEVREYAENHIMNDSRFSSIAENKDNLAIGNSFLVIQAFPHVTRISVNVVTLQNVSLTEGLQFGYRHFLQESQIYSKAELSQVLDIVENFGAQMMGITKRKRKSVDLKFPRFIVNTREEAGNGEIKEDILSFKGNQYRSVESVKSYLDNLFNSTAAIALIIDTKDNTVTEWKKNS